MRPIAIVMLVTSAILCNAQENSPRVADSLVLERTQCYGTCPAYRLSVTSRGIVSFQSRNPGDSTSARDSMAPTVFRALIVRAIAAGVYTLPSRIADDRRICRDHATDHPTATITIFADNSATRVEDYLGCYQASDHSQGLDLRELRDFEQAIDITLDSRRWVRPARFR